MKTSLTIKKVELIKKITLWISLFLLIYGYESIFANPNRIGDGGRYKSLINIITIICFLLSVMMVAMRKIVADKSFFLLFCMSASILISMLWNNDYTAGVVLKIMIIVTGYGIFKIYGLRNFSSAFIKIMKFLAICSLIVYIVGIFAFPLIQIFPTVITENRIGVDSSFANLGVSIVPYYTELRFRNYSVFREPGVYQAFLNVALIFLLFVKEQKNDKKDMIIFSLAIISTLSTTGIVAWLLIMVAYFLSSKNREEKVNTKTKLLVFGFVAISMLAVVFLPDISSIVFSKLTNGSVSWYSRFNSIWSNIHVFLLNPLFGVGMTQLNTLLQEYLSSINLTGYLHNTNTIFTQFSSYGVFFGSIYVYGLFRFFKVLSQNTAIRVLLAVAIIILLFGENFDTNFLFAILLFLGFDKKEMRI